MRRVIGVFVGMLIATASTAALAGGAEGVWRTEADDEGAYLEVTIGSCESDSSKTCGKITKAMTQQGVDPKYPNLGVLMVKDMESGDGTDYSGGTIWDPVHDKTFNSKMHLRGDDLDVKGCVSIICSGQDWKRVK
ncbi:MAG: DUF2147 domain-containing protein [Longimicrobiales bacterium]